MKRVLKNELCQLMQAAPPLPDAAKKAQLMEQARSKRLSLSTETSMLQFIKGQIRFVNKSLFACQLLLLCLYGLFTTMILKDSDGFLLLVAAAPLVVLLGSGELSRSFPLSHDRAGIAVALFAAADFHGKVCDRGGGGYAVAHLYADYDRDENVFHLWRIDPIWTCAELSGGIRLVVPAQQKPECEYTLLCDCLLCRPICVRSCFCKRPPGLVR